MDGTQRTREMVVYSSGSHGAANFFFFGAVSHGLGTIGGDDDCDAEKGSSRVCRLTAVGKASSTTVYIYL